MAILRLPAIALVFAAACYGPDAPDCTLACTADSDCVSGQACTSDHLCATTGITSCGAHAVVDGNNAIGSDAGSGSGSATYVTLMLNVDGNGSASTSDGQTCDSLMGMKTCPLQVVKGQALTLTATPHLTKTFDKWTGGPCDTQPNPCQTTPNGPITVQTKFKN